MSLLIFASVIIGLTLTPTKANIEAIRVSSASKSNVVRQAVGEYFLKEGEVHGNVWYETKKTKHYLFRNDQGRWGITNSEKNVYASKGLIIMSVSNNSETPFDLNYRFYQGDGKWEKDLTLSLTDISKEIILRKKDAQNHLKTVRAAADRAEKKRLAAEKEKEEKLLAELEAMEQAKIAAAAAEQARLDQEAAAREAIAENLRLVREERLAQFIKARDDGEDGEENDDDEPQLVDGWDDENDEEKSDEVVNEDDEPSVESDDDDDNEPDVTNNNNKEEEQEVESDVGVVPESDETKQAIKSEDEPHAVDVKKKEEVFNEEVDVEPNGQMKEKKKKKIRKVTEVEEKQEQEEKEEEQNEGSQDDQEEGKENIEDEEPDVEEGGRGEEEEEQQQQQQEEEEGGGGGGEQQQQQQQQEEEEEEPLLPEEKEEVKVSMLDKLKVFTVMVEQEIALQDDEEDDHAVRFPAMLDVSSSLSDIDIVSTVQGTYLRLLGQRMKEAPIYQLLDLSAPYEKMFPIVSHLHQYQQQQGDNDDEEQDGDGETGKIHQNHEENEELNNEYFEDLFKKQKDMRYLYLSDSRRWTFATSEGNMKSSRGGIVSKSAGKKGEKILSPIKLKFIYNNQKEGSWLPDTSFSIKESSLNIDEMLNNAVVDDNDVAGVDDDHEENHQEEEEREEEPDV